MSNDSNLEVLAMTVRIPVGEIPAGFEKQRAAQGVINMGRTHLQVQLAPHLAETMLQVRQGLRVANAKLDGDRPVYTTPDALRWLLQLIYDAKKCGVQHLQFSDPFGLVECDAQGGADDQPEPEEVKGEPETEQPSPEDDKQEMQEHDASKEDEMIAEYLVEHGLGVTNKSVIEALRRQDVIVQSPQVTAVKKQLES